MQSWVHQPSHDLHVTTANHDSCRAQHQLADTQSVQTTAAQTSHQVTLVVLSIQVLLQLLACSVNGPEGRLFYRMLAAQQA